MPEFQGKVEILKRMILSFFFFQRVFISKNQCEFQSSNAFSNSSKKNRRFLKFFSYCAFFPTTCSFTFCCFAKFLNKTFSLLLLSKLPKKVSNLCYFYFQKCVFQNFQITQILVILQFCVHKAKKKDGSHNGFLPRWWRWRRR